MISADPTCGNCGKRYSEHHLENEVYCFADTTGDLFTDNPTDDHVGSWLAARHPEMYAQIKREWREENGHI